MHSDLMREPSCYTLAATALGAMFKLALAFNAAIGGWDVSKVIEMREPFREATAFNQDLGAWDTARVVDLDNMFPTPSI